MQRELRDYESRLDYDNRLRQFHLQQLVVEAEMRTKYSGLLSIFIVIWLSTVLSIVILQGIHVTVLGFADLTLRTSDTVLTVLIGSTTVNVIGLLMIVMRYIFRYSAGQIQPVSGTTLPNKNSQVSHTTQ